MKSAAELEKIGISAEVIDIQSLIPFDLSHEISESVKKTNRVVIIDEDVAGGATAFILQQILEKQKELWLARNKKSNLAESIEMLEAVFKLGKLHYKALQGENHE